MQEVDCIADGTSKDMRMGPDDPPSYVLVDHWLDVLGFPCKDFFELLQHGMKLQRANVVRDGSHISGAAIAHFVHFFKRFKRPLALGENVPSASSRCFN